MEIYSPPIRNFSGRDVYKVKKIGKTSFMKGVQSSWVEVERFREVFLYKICLEVLYFEEEMTPADAQDL